MGIGLLGFDWGARELRKSEFGLLCSLCLSSLFLHDTLVVSWQDLDEVRKRTSKVEKNASSQLRASVMVVIFNQATNKGNL